MSYNLFIDDMRYPEDVTACLGKKWVIARNMSEVEWLVDQSGPPDFVSFDHDMTDAHYGGNYSDGQTGADIAFVLIRLLGGQMCDYQVHSLNPDGARRIHDAIKRAALAKKEEG